MIRVLVADDQTLIRSAVRELIGDASDMQVVDEATDGSEAVAKTTRLVPDVVLMDVHMPVLDGIAATAQIRAAPALGNVRVLVLTAFDQYATMVQALRAGADGFLGKGAEPQELLAAVRSVHAGDAVLSARATRGLIDRHLADTGSASRRPTPIRPGTAAIGDLTPREVEVLRLVGRGSSNQQIAQELTISPATAKTHVSRTMAKLGARDRAQLVVAAYEHGLVIPGTSRGRAAPALAIVRPDLPRAGWSGLRDHGAA